MEKSFDHFYKNFITNKVIKVHSRLVESLKFYPAGAAALHLSLLPFRLTLLPPSW